MKNKRFIAGATCSNCGAFDKVFTFEIDGVKWRGCAACDYTEQFQEQHAVTEELPTRVNQSRLDEPTLAHETELQRVRLIDPKQSS